MSQLQRNVTSCLTVNKQVNMAQTILWKPVFPVLHDVPQSVVDAVRHRLAADYELQTKTDQLEILKRSSKTSVNKFIFDRALSYASLYVSLHSLSIFAQDTFPLCLADSRSISKSLLFSCVVGSVTISTSALIALVAIKYAHIDTRIPS